MTERTRVRGAILDRLGEDAERVFYIDRIEDGRFMLIEACDEYFGTTLTADELRALAHEILAAVVGEETTQKPSERR